MMDYGQRCILSIAEMLVLATQMAKLLGIARLLTFVDIIFQRYSFYPRKSYYVPQNHEVEAGVQNPVIIKYINFYLFYGISCIRLLLAERNGEILK